MTALWRIYLKDFYFLKKIREGQEDAEKGNLIEPEEVEKKFAKWLK